MKDITDQIKTFQDACTALGMETTESLPTLLQPEFADVVPPHVKAMLELEIIVAALNEGWKFRPDQHELGYYPWFWLVTDEEISRMDDEEKKERNIIPVDGISKEYAGLGFASTSYAWSNSLSFFGSRLACRTSDLARYCGRQFIGMWKEFLFIPE